MPGARVLGAKVLGGKVLGARVLGAKVLSARVLGAKVLGAKVLRVTVLAFVVFGATPGTQGLPPELTAPVNDFARVIPPEYEQQLDDLSRNLLAASGDTIVVATVDTFQPYADLPSYAVEMFENRGKGIGQKGKDNGLLVVLAVKDRAVRVEVGYDLEGIITDGFAGETSRETMVPFFRTGDYGGGLLAGTARIAARIAEARNVTLDNVPQPAVPVQPSIGGDIPWIVFLIIGMVIWNMIRSSVGPSRRRRRGRWSSHVGPFGAGYGGWSGGAGGFGGGFGGFGGGRSGGGGGGASW